jgi:hypothetical protein
MTTIGVLVNIKIIYSHLIQKSLVFCVVLCRSLFVLFLLSIVLSVLHFMTYDYPFWHLQTFLSYNNKIANKVLTIIV